jgi:uncharacterized protein YbjT (DUF2867 family)
MPSPGRGIQRDIIVVAGATGRLGGLIIAALRERGARVRAVVRHGTAKEKRIPLERAGADVVAVDYGDAAQLARACGGASCVVSALAGLGDVIIDAQSSLLDAAVASGVPRFIPSDFAIDFYRMPPGYNRNLDLRREFAKRLDAAPIAATSVLNGMFADLLRGQAPFILTPLRRVVYWRDADQPMDFTTIEDTAAFTAAAALDPTTPRFLRIAGEVASARDLATIASEVKGKPFRLLRAGDLQRLERIIRFTQRIAPGTDDVYPPWQGMQYMHNMYDGRAKLAPLDNDRYREMRWTGLRDVLSAEPGSH